MSEFALDPRLAADSVFVIDAPLSQVRLMNDARFPWLILVPRVANVAELIELDSRQQHLLLAEINQISKLLHAEPGVTKLNIAALGNVVRQLHVHLIGRHDADAAWPRPVWGSGVAQAFTADELEARLDRWRSQLG